MLNLIFFHKVSFCRQLLANLRDTMNTFNLEILLEDSIRFRKNVLISSIIKKTDKPSGRKWREFENGCHDEFITLRTINDKMLINQHFSDKRKIIFMFTYHHYIMRRYN